MSNRIEDKAKARDENTCQKCGRTRQKSQMHAHHIHPKWAGGKDESDNLVTLCPQCHRFAPEATTRELAEERIEAYLSTGVRPEVDLFTFGMEYAIWNQRHMECSSPNRFRETMQRYVEHARRNSDVTEPVHHDTYRSVLYNVVAGFRDEFKDEQEIRA